MNVASIPKLQNNPHFQCLDFQTRKVLSMQHNIGSMPDRYVRITSAQNNGLSQVIFQSILVYDQPNLIW